MQVLQSTGCLQDPQLNIYLFLSSGYLYNLPAQQQRGQASSVPPFLLAPVT